jgi:HTH-type transcriptional regulator / antitoxin HigA
VKTTVPAVKSAKPSIRKTQPGTDKAVTDDGYMALIRLHRLKPIRSHDELDTSIALLNELLARSKSLTVDEIDYLECLSHEIEYYEEDNIPMPPVDPIAMLKYLIDTREVTNSEVARGAGIAVSTLSALLNGKRKLTLDHITRLAEYFHTKPSLFVN